MAGSTWHVFANGGLGRADHMNENFDWLEGDILPMNAGVTADNTYKFGTGTLQWRSGYFTGIVISGGTMTSVDNTSVEVSSGNIRLKNGGVRGTTANSSGTQREIAQGTISTPDIRDNAVTNATTTGAGSQNSGTIVCTVALTVATTTAQVLVCASACFRPTGSNPGGDIDIDFCITKRVNGGAATAITGGKLNRTIKDIGIASTEYMSINLNVLDSPGGANAFYDLRYTLNTGFSIVVGPFAMSMVELRK